MGQTVCLALVISSILCMGNALPISGQDVLAGISFKHYLGYLFGTTIAVIICLISVLIICGCWGKKKRLKLQSISSQIELQNQSGAPNLFVSNLSSPLSTSDPKVYFEPLPDITPRAQVKKVSVCLAQSENWFAEPYQNFPRNQLQYIRKIGAGWFGQVLEGRAVGIDTDHTSTAFSRLASEVNCNTVVVKCLREDATIDEQSYFLQELLPYKKLRHSNLLRVLSFCLETQPFLILLEYCDKGDLKSVLKKETFSDVYLLRMAVGVAEGLSHMHTHKFIHTDIAARNCLVAQDFVVKIGDYGNSIEAYKNEYYLAERIALPLRWCAPESLHCTETTIETVELTMEANVWSFGVLFWEILSRGQFPYETLGNDEIIQKVILEKSVRLQNPLQSIQIDAINEILEACFVPRDSRKNMEDVTSMLHELSAAGSTEDDFDKRWNKLSSPVKNTSIDENCPDFSSIGDRFPQNERQSLSIKNEKVICENSENRDPLVPPISTFGCQPCSPLPTAEDPFDNFPPICGVKQTVVDESLSATCTDVNVPNCAENFSDPKQEWDKWSKLLTESEEDFLTKRLEQGEFSELVRMKSKSVQDLMCLTVIDYSSDSSERASQMGSLPGDPSSLVSEKNFSSEGNLKEAVRDDRFMMELERLQVEHRYSIISEASRDEMSIEDRTLLDEFNGDQKVPCFSDDRCNSNGQINCSLSAPKNPTFPQTNSSESNPQTSITSDAIKFEHFSTISGLSKADISVDCNALSGTNQTCEGYEACSSIRQETRPDECSPSDKGPESANEEIDGGQFWKLQMTAWQEAAQETKELLQEAAKSGTDAYDYLTDSPQKHSETSEEDSETYISYDTPKEEDDIYQYDSEINPADILALRNELSLKLTSSTEVSADLEKQDEMIINYRSGPVSLSPIKEESIFGECESLDDTDISSVEEDFSRDTGKSGFRGSFEVSNISEKISDSFGNSRMPMDEWIEISEDMEANSVSLVDSGVQNLVLSTEDAPSKYLCSSVCEPLEPDSGYANMLGRDITVGPHYQGYFNAGVSNVLQCGASLEDGSIYDSTDHTSLPYEVNFPDKFIDLGGNGAVSSDNWSLTLASNNNDLSDALRSLDLEEYTSNDEAPPPDSSSEEKLKQNNEELPQNGTKKVKEVESIPLPSKDTVESACSADDEEDSPDEDSDTETSSTSGEFVWVGNEMPSNQDVRVKDTADSNLKLPSDGSEDESDSGEEEFTPSMWNSQLTPKQSLLKSSEMNSPVKKIVQWKRQKHHRVYEYPPEPATWHAEEPQQRRMWGGHNLDYLTLADWEYVEEFSLEDSEPFEQLLCTNHTSTVSSIYNIAPLSYPNDDSMVVDDCDFLMRSGTPFPFKKSSFSANEYFPSDTPLSDANSAHGINSTEQPGATGNSVGEMRYSKDNLRLNLPPILGADYHNEILDNQKSEDEVLNNEDCSNCQH